MRIEEIIEDETRIAPELAGATKDDVLRELADALRSCHAQVDAARLVDVLWERERLGSTAIGDGIAIPHGKLPGLEGVIGIFGRHRAGVEFESLDGGPTHLLFLLVAPEESVGQHLKALARVSRLLKEASFRDRLLAAEGAEEIFRLICDEDGKL